MAKTFAPRDAGTVTVAATTTSADEAIAAGCHAIRIVNTSDGVAHVKTAAGSALTATTADFPVGPGQSAVMNIKSAHTMVAVILAAGAMSANVYVTPGSSGSAV